MLSHNESVYCIKMYNRRYFSREVVSRPTPNPHVYNGHKEVSLQNSVDRILGILTHSNYNTVQYKKANLAKIRQMYMWIFRMLHLVTKSVRITNIKVPTTYIIEQQKELNPLILDCEYEIGPKETGLVVKWFLNDTAITQWIPSKGRIIGLTYMKNRLDTAYTVTNHPIYKYRAISIKNPSWNLTGEYSCGVQTYQTADRRSSYLQIIVAETDFQLFYNVSRWGDVFIYCIVRNIFPAPRIQIILNDDQNLKSRILTNTTLDGLYTTMAIGTINKLNLDSPTAINCILTINGTNYTKKKETIYYDSLPMPTNHPSHDEMSSAIFRAEESNSCNSINLFQLHKPRVFSLLGIAAFITSIINTNVQLTL